MECSRYSLPRPPQLKMQSISAGGRHTKIRQTWKARCWKLQPGIWGPTLGFSTQMLGCAVQTHLELRSVEERWRLATLWEGGLMLRCSMYTSVTVLVSQYARQELMPG